MVDKFIQYFTSAIQLLWTDGVQDCDELEAASQIYGEIRWEETFQRVIVMMSFKQGKPILLCYWTLKQQL